MQTFFNQNQILGIELIPVDKINWKVGENLFPFSQVFHCQQIQKKRVTIAYAVTEGQTTIYRSLCDDKVVNDYDALVEKTPITFNGNQVETPIPLILDIGDISFKATQDKQRAGILYTNKLEYSLPKVTDSGQGMTDMEKLEQQLELLQSGQAFHLLFQLYSCETGRGIVLCPEPGAFSASVDDTIKTTKVSITVKNLTAHQFLK